MGQGWLNGCAWEASRYFVRRVNDYAELWKKDEIKREEFILVKI